ncbi:hypothetical protein [Jiella sp. M17.18]|uniref:hypothetical protein n=1 Tax=Jiella sp. M17.18 TaxID=3234247 RepID=UPI0034DFEADA
MTPSTFISKIQDRRVDCWSFLVEKSVSDYLSLIDTAYSNRGGIKHQRVALKTTSARRIRARLVEDLRRGAVIPPLVIGLVVEEGEWEGLSKISDASEVDNLFVLHQSELSIIDGMQRTTALTEALELDASVGAHMVRVEAWVARSAESLIYRMLVLNTGQVPWNLKQQLEVIYAPLIKTISQKVTFTRLLTGRERRRNGGEFKSDALIECYIAFGLRRTEVDTQESLADEFSRLDVAEALTNKKYDRYFYRIIQMLVNIDTALSAFNASTDDSDLDDGFNDDLSGGQSKVRVITRGRNIFDTQAARVGFVVACAVAILGRVGMDKEEAFSDLRCATLEVDCARLVDRLQKASSEELGNFLALDVLMEKLGHRPSSAVGRWERAFFEKSFKVLVEESFEVPTMEPCWRA